MTLVPVRGWWRRNALGLVLLLPLLLAAVYGPWRQEAYDRLVKGKPRVPVVAAAGTPVEFAGSRIRLLDLAEVHDVVDYGGRPVTVPGAAIWRARVAFESVDHEKLGGCTVQLEDRQGRRFDDRPSELRDRQAKLSTDGGCRYYPPFDRPDQPPEPTADGRAKYQTTYFFIMPASSQPAGVRVSLATEYPRFAWLSAP